MRSYRYDSMTDPFWCSDVPRVDEYDADGCLRLLAAIVRRWWLDGLWQRDGMLDDLAEFMEVDVSLLRDNRPAKFYSRSGDWRQQ